MSNTIARSISKCTAFALFAQLNDDGTASAKKTDSVEFFTTNPEGKGVRDEAARALRNAGIRATAKDVRFSVLSTAVYAMTMEDFMEHATIVDRAKGGYIKKSDLAGAAEVEDSEN